MSVGAIEPPPGFTGVYFAGTTLPPAGQGSPGSTLAEALAGRRRLTKVVAHDNDLRGLEETETEAIATLGVTPTGH
jgi:hypothetical protein